MIIVMQAVKKWIPFLKNTNEYEIKHDSFLVDTLFLALTSNHKSILGSIILSFVFMECVFMQMDCYNLSFNLAEIHP